MAGIMGLLTASSNFVHTTRRLKENETSKVLLDNAGDMESKDKGWRDTLLQRTFAKGKSKGTDKGSAPDMMESITRDSRERGWNRTLLHWPITNKKGTGKRGGKGPSSFIKGNLKWETDKRTLLNWPITKVRRQGSVRSKIISDSMGKETEKKGWKRLSWPFRKGKDKGEDAGEIEVLLENWRNRTNRRQWERDINGSYVGIDNAKETKKTRRWIPLLHRGEQGKQTDTNSGIMDTIEQKTNKKGWRDILPNWALRNAKTKGEENGKVKVIKEEMKDCPKRRTWRRRRMPYWPTRKRKKRRQRYGTISMLLGSMRTGPKRRKSRLLLWPLGKAKRKRKEKRTVGEILAKMKKDSRRRKEKRLLHWPSRKGKKSKGKGRKDTFEDETLMWMSEERKSTKVNRWARLKAKAPKWLFKGQKSDTAGLCDVISNRKITGQVSYRIAPVKRQPYSPIGKKKRKGGKTERRTERGEFEFDVSAEWDGIRQERMKHVRKINIKKAKKTKRPVVKDYDVCYKVLMVGDSNAGKSALLRSLAGSDFQAKSQTTVGMDFVSTTVEVDGARIKLQIWDTAGQERFRSMTRFQFRGTQGAILAYDISDRETFKTLEYWLKMVDSEIDQHNKEPIPVYLIGNKSDINKRQVSYKQGKQLAEEHLMRGYIETSAKTGRNVGEAFTQLGQAIIEINHPKLMDSYLDKFDREDKYEQRKKEAEALAQYQLQKRRSRIRLPSNITRAKSLEKRAQKCCAS